MVPFLSRFLLEQTTHLEKLKQTVYPRLGIAHANLFPDTFVNEQHTKIIHAHSSAQTQKN